MVTTIGLKKRITVLGAGSVSGSVHVWALPTVSVSEFGNGVMKKGGPYTSGFFTLIGRMYVEELVPAASVNLISMLRSFLVTIA